MKPYQQGGIEHGQFETIRPAMTSRTFSTTGCPETRGDREHWQFRAWLSMIGIYRVGNRVVVIGAL